MNFDTLIKKRRSIRSFNHKKPDWRKIMIAIEAANQGPFAGNYNNLNFIIVEDKSKINKIAEANEQFWIAESKLIIIVCSDTSLLEHIYGDFGKVYSRQQSGAAIMTLQFKLEDFGINSCWVAPYDEEATKEILEIPEKISIEAIIPTGYANKIPVKRPKKLLEKTIFWDKWGTDKKPFGFTETLQEFPR